MAPRRNNGVSLEFAEVGTRIGYDHITVTETRQDLEPASAPWSHRHEPGPRVAILDDKNHLELPSTKQSRFRNENPLYQLGYSLQSVCSTLRKKLGKEAARQLIEMIERDRNHGR